MIFTFWEGPLPAYIGLCLETWDFEYRLLHFGNLSQYTDLDVEKIKRFTLAQISDIVRVHVLRDNGGIWIDTDTIMITGNKPKTNMIGVPEERGAHCGYLRFEKGARMLKKWAEYQDEIIYSDNPGWGWDIFANRFSDEYIQAHPSITICDRTKFIPESTIIKGNIPAKDKYIRFYFKERHHLSDIGECDMLMLHNSWTPEWYKRLSEERLFQCNCTMTNILKETLA